MRVRSNATKEEIEEMVEHGLDAMFDAHENGEVNPAVTFLHGGEEDNKEEEEVVEENQGQDEEVITDDDGTDNDKNEIDDEEKISCADCGKEPCFFLCTPSCSWPSTKPSTGIKGADVPANSVRRKKLHCQLTLVINGGPLGAGIRKPLPECCVFKVWEMLPSDSFTGFRAE